MCYVLVWIINPPWYAYLFTVGMCHMSALMTQDFHGMFLHWMGIILLQVNIKLWSLLIALYIKNKICNQISSFCFLFIVCSSPIDIPEMKYGWLAEKTTASHSWSWLDVSNPIPRCSEKVYNILFCTLWKCIDSLWYLTFLTMNWVSSYQKTMSWVSCNDVLQIRSLLSSLQFSIMKIPVKDVSDCLTKGIIWPWVFMSKSCLPY